jgi:kynurenine 3-monooxygenase
MPTKTPTVTLIGAGLAGSLLAIYLARRGFNVQIFERRPDMRVAKAQAGRSINLALSVRGIAALQHVGLAEQVLSQSIAMKGRIMHSRQGELTFQPYGKNDSEVIYSVSRATLNKLLMTEAEANGVKIFFEHKCTGIDIDTHQIELELPNGKTNWVEAHPVIGTDGSSSAIRSEMIKRPRYNFSQAYENYGYKELTIPPSSSGEFQLEKHALHIWARGSFLLIALPNMDRSFTCTLFLLYESTDAASPNFKELNSPERVRDFFQHEFSDALVLMPHLADEFFENPTGHLVTVKCAPWNIGGDTLLLGDAAHAIVPFYGQGMNCSFEDCLYFDDAVAKYGAEWETVFSEFYTRRKADADAIADLAQENFIEMRDKVANPKFLMMKKAELLLEKKFPNEFLSKYAMVTFNRVPYSDALRDGRRQEKILLDLCTPIESLDDLNLDEAYRKIKMNGEAC